MRRACSGNKKGPQGEAFSLLELVILIAVMGALIVVFVPPLLRARLPAARISCANCLKQIGLAMKTWELDNNNQFPMGLLATNTDARELVASGAVFPYFVVLSNELYTPKILVCPKDEQRKPALDFARLADANISYFLNVDVTPDDRADVVLSGDGNLTNRLAPGQSFVSLTPKTQIGWDKGIHAENGHLLFCDGSVGGYSNGGMVVRISLVGTETNRLALPRRITSSLKQE